MVLVGRRGSAIRDVRRAARRVRRALRPRNLITGGILLGSLLVILASLSGPPSRATVYRTEPVLRALPEGALPGRSRGVGGKALRAGAG